MRQCRHSQGSDVDRPAEGSDTAPPFVRAFWQLFNRYPSQVALMALDGTILAVNAAWDRFARENGIAAGYDFVGQNYLSACEQGVAADVPGAREAYVGILDVLRNGRPKFTMTCPCHSPTQQRWYRLWVEPQTPSIEAVIVAHQLIESRPRTTGDATGGGAGVPPA